MAVRTSYDNDPLCADALGTLARLGWVVDASDGQFRAGGDFLIADAFALSRFWHTAIAAHSDSLRAHSVAARYAATLIIEGSGAYTVDGQRLPIEPGTLLIHGEDAAVSLQTSAPVSAVRVSHRWHAILPTGIRREDVPAYIRPSARSAALLTTQTAQETKPRAPACASRHRSRPRRRRTLP